MMTLSKLKENKGNKVFKMWNSFERYEVETIEIIQCGNKIAKTDDGDFRVEFAMNSFCITKEEVLKEISEHKKTNKFI